MLGQNCLNVFHYRCVENGWTDNTNEYEELLIEMSENQIPAMKGIQSQAFAYTLATIENLSNEIDYDTLDLTGVFGNNTGECMPTFNAFSLKFVGETKETKAGGKRIAGVPEVGANNGVLVPAWDAVMIALADELADDIVISNPVLPSQVIRLRPIILGSSNIPPYYDLGRWNNVKIVQWKRKVSSQVSRKSLT